MALRKSCAVISSLRSLAVNSLRCHLRLRRVIGHSGDVSFNDVSEANQ